MNKQMLDMADAVMGSLLKPRERRIYDDEYAFADRAAWLDAHQIKEDRRKQRNIITECNSPEGCYDMGGELI